MTRYLTPAKIGLLVLIELYTESVVSAESTIPVLSFIISHLLPSSLPKPQNPLSDPEPNEDVRSFIISVSDFRTFLIAHQAAAGHPGRTLWDLFLKKLWEIDSLDQLHIFFDQRSQLLAKTKEDLQNDALLGVLPEPPTKIRLSRTSPFGAFGRKAQLEFERLKFHDALNLWKSFISYRQVTLPAWRKRNTSAGEWSFDVVLDHGGVAIDGLTAAGDENLIRKWDDEEMETFATIAYGNNVENGEDHEGLVSTDDVEKLLEFQIEQMQKLGTRVPDVVQNQFKDVLDTNILTPSLSHYVNFLDAWRAGDYPTSFDNLHRFFDYTMQNRDRLFYQYALLNLAVLQADFGCYQEAVAAMQETVATARENKDMGCLNFSLSWLYHFGKAHPSVINKVDPTNMLGVEREGLAFLRMKAKESGMWSLWSSSLLSEAKMGLSSGESIATAFENILRSSHLSATKNMMNNLGPQMMLQSSLWSRLGVTQLAWSYCEIFLQCHAQQAPFDDILKFTCRTAYLLTQKGHYDEAMEKLESLDPNSLRSLKPKQYWQMFRGIIRLKRDLHRNNLDGADQLLSQLLQCQGGDSDLAFEMNTLHIDAMMRRGDYSAALSKIENLATGLKETGEDIYSRVQLLIMKARLFEKCNRPQKGFSIAVRAASVAWRARLLPSLWEAMGAIANILTSLQEFEASAQILAAVLPRALEYENCALSAQLFSFLVDAHMGMAGQADPASLKRTENLTKAKDFIDRAFNEYSNIEDIDGQCEMMAKKATIMHLVGDLVLANDYAAAYLELRNRSADPDM